MRPQLRQEAFLRFAPHVILALNDSRPDHVFQRDSGRIAGPDVVANAALENWVLGECDYFVISLWSGYGRTAAARRGGWSNIITLDNRDPRDRDCLGGPFDHFPFIATLQVPGIRRKRHRTQ